MFGVYDSEIEPEYIPGIGTGPGLDFVCQGIGCGIDSNQIEAQKGLLDNTINRDDNYEYLFFPIDITSFSRGSTTGADFINKIDNQNYWNLGLLTRSHLMFDPVGSYGIAGNGIDIGRDFSTPTNVIAIQINAQHETRNLFDLQSLQTSQGALASPNWTEITLPGVHATIGGGYKDSEQGKTQDMTFYSMQTMINHAEQYGVKFRDIPQNQRPSQAFNQLMDRYNQSRTSLEANPSDANKRNFGAIDGMIKDISVHDSTIRLNKPWELHNYSIGSERGKYYPNDKYLDN